MTHQNAKHCRGLPIAMLALAIGSAVPLTTYATPSQFGVTFTARVLTTTYDMTVNDGATGDTATAYTDNADHKVTLGDLINQQNNTATSGSTIATFNIEASGCPTSLQSIKTTATGTQNGNKVLVPSNTSDGDAKDVGVKIAHVSAPDQPSIIFTSMTASTDGSEVVLWDTASEVSDGKQLDLIAHSVPTPITAVGLTTGKFNTIATFSFNYE